MDPKTDIEKRLRMLELKQPEKDGSAKATVWWALGNIRLIAAFLGGTMLWQIPSPVTKKVGEAASGKIEQRAHEQLAAIAAVKEDVIRQQSEVHRLLAEMQKHHKD